MTDIDESPVYYDRLHKRLTIVGDDAIFDVLVASLSEAAATQGIDISLQPECREVEIIRNYQEAPKPAWWGCLVILVVAAFGLPAFFLMLVGLITVCEW